MKGFFHGVLCALLLILLCASHAFAAQPDGFFTTWGEVKTAAKTQHKLIYLHFTTTWCGWCRKIEKDTYTAPAAKEALKSFVAASLDCTVARGQQPVGETKTNVELFDKFGGQGYPYLVMLSEDGEAVLHTINGYVSADRFVEELKIAKKANQEYLNFLAYAAKADKNSLDFAVRALSAYTQFGQREKAVATARRILKLDPDDKSGQGAQCNWILFEALPLNEREGEKGTAFVKEILRLDPENAKGMLEKAMMSAALDPLRNVNPRDEARIKELLPRSEQRLTELITRAKTLQDAQYTYAMLGLVQEMRGNLAAAIATLEKAIAFNPQSTLAARLKQRIGELQQKVQK